MFNFKGLATALITPFTDDDEIDYEALGRLINEQIAEKIPGIVVLGSTGENFAISNKEYESIIQFAVKNFTGKVKIIVGSGNNDTHNSILRSKKAEDLGADAVLTVNPYYNKPTQQGLFKHFSAIAENIDIPLILYNIPGRAAVNLEADTVLNLANTHKNIIGIKESSGRRKQLMDLIKDKPDNFMILSGDDDLIYPTMTLGGTGAISVISNIIPHYTREMMYLLLDHQYKPSRDLHYKMLPLMQSLISIGTNPIAIKTLLAYQNKIKENFRLPLCPLENEQKKQLIKIFESFCNG